MANQNWQWNWKQKKKADYLPKSFSPIVGQQIDSVTAAATHKKR